MSKQITIAMVGNPNAGKSALFNALTGARQKIANYPGVTVERKGGRLVLPSGEPVELTDLPGSYGLHATSPDEEVTRMVIMGEFPGEAAPDVLVVVLDASNLEQHLVFAQEVIAPEFSRQQKLGDVIKLLVPQRDWLRNWELEHLLAVRRPTLLALREELRAVITDGAVRVPRAALINFFNRRIVR